MGILQRQVVRRAHYTWSVTSIFWTAFSSITVSSCKNVGKVCTCSDMTQGQYPTQRRPRGHPAVAGGGVSLLLGC